MEMYDIVMLCVLGGATLFGFWKGIAWQLAALASYAASYVVSLKFSDRLAPYFGQQAPLNRFLAMAAIYAGTSLVIWLGFRLIKETINKVQLGSFDRQLGAVVGAAKGVVLCVVVTFFAVGLNEQLRESVLRSRSGHYIAELIRQADPVMPPEIHQVLDPYLEQLENELEPGGKPIQRLGRTKASPKQDDPFGPRLDDGWVR